MVVVKPRFKARDKGLTLISILLMLSVVGIPQLAAGQTIEQLVQQGNEAQAAGNFSEAEAIWRRVLQDNPNNADAYYNLGRALSNQGKLEEAIAAYRQALKIYPNYAPAYNNLGVALRDQGKLEEAIAAYRQALKIHPNNAIAYNNLGVALRDQGKLEEAIAAYRQALKIHPNDAIAYNNLGNALRNQGKLEEAIVAYRQVIKINPNYVSPYVDLGLALYDQGKLEEAIAAYHQALKMYPNYAPAYYNLAEAERLLALRRNPQPILFDDRQWVPSQRDEPLVAILRPVVRIIAKIPNGNNIGAGWVVKRQGNRIFIITNRHVVSDEQGTKRQSNNIEVEFFSEAPNNNRRRQPAKIVHITNPNDSLDLAILEVTEAPEDIEPLQILSGRVSRATPVRIIGHPFNGGVWAAVPGEVSNYNPNEDKILIDATLAQGNSGGPVLDEKNRVIALMVQITNNADINLAQDNLPPLSSQPATSGFGFAYRIEVVMEQLHRWGIF